MIGQTIAERYRIEEKVGEGGMGVAYRASDLRLDRTIALASRNWRSPNSQTPLQRRPPSRQTNMAERRQ